MKIRHLSFISMLATLGVLMGAANANAASFRLLNGFTDTDFQTQIANGDFTELFVAESRMGNNQTNGDRELGINTATGTPVAQGQRVWSSGQAVNFVLEYTGSVVNYTVGGQLLSSTAFSGPVTDIFLRTRAAANSSLSLTNLVFNGQAFSDLGSAGAGGNSDVDYLQISKLSAPFTLTGTSTMTWTGAAPRSSQMAYQIKVGTSPNASVPEPGTVLALTVGAGAFSVIKRKRDLNEDA